MIVSQLRKAVNHPKQYLLKRERERQAEKLRMSKSYYSGCEFAQPKREFLEPAFGTSEWLLEEELRSLKGVALIQSSGKLMVLDRLLLALRSRKSRVLIFSQWTETLDILEEYVQFRFGAKGEAFYRLDGETNRLMRELDVRAFNRPDSRAFIYLISTNAGGMGINLATADTVVLYDSSWNPQVDLQAQDRAHRIGQQKQVTVYRLVSENCFEEKVIEIAERKQMLDHLVIAQQTMEMEAKLEKIDSEEDLSISDLLKLFSGDGDTEKVSAGNMFDYIDQETIREVDSKLNAFVVNPGAFKGGILNFHGAFSVAKTAQIALANEKAMKLMLAAKKDAIDLTGGMSHAFLLSR